MSDIALFGDGGGEGQCCISGSFFFSTLGNVQLRNFIAVTKKRYCIFLSFKNPLVDFPR